MIAPKITQRIITNNKKTIIFALLANNDLLKLVEAPINLFIFKILKTLISLKALSAAIDCAPNTNNEIYLGIIDS